MRSRLLVLSILSVALAAGAGWYIYRTLDPGAAAPATVRAAPPGTVQTVNGETVVTVSPDMQRASHIDTAPLAATPVQADTTAYATVIDLQPLFDLGNRLAAARADLDTLRAQAGNSRAQFERSHALFEDDRNISQKSLQDARAAMQADQAKLQSADAARSGLEAMMRQQFGDALTRAAMAPASDLFRRLLAGRAAILRVTLPIGPGGPAPARITVDAPDGHPVPAQELSASPQGDPAIQGNPYLYTVTIPVPVGTRTRAQVPSPTPVTSALVIPEDAVVWYGGQPWVYVRTAIDRFTRRAVPADASRGRGFIVTDGFHAGDAVVMHGAQLLLSEEQKPQGISTVCKDPPECDD